MIQMPESEPVARVILLFLVVLFRYLILASIAFLLFYRSSFIRRHFQKIQQKFPAHGDYLREIAYSFFTAVIFTMVGWLTFMTPFRSYTRVYTSLQDHSLGYFILSIILMLLVHDTYFYWTHRAMHHPAVFRIFHRVHHLSVNPSPWAAMAFHPLEAFVEAGIIVVIALCFPVHPLAIAIFLLIMMSYNVYGHLGYELYPESFHHSRIGRWVNTSIHHNQHHQFFQGNYGLYFLWWDRWMKTLREEPVKTSSLPG
jgi:Delta7-sterol 5-desaturase